MKRSRGPLLAVLTLLPALAWGMPHGTVILNDGRRFEDVDYEVRGREVRVVSKYGATVFPMTDVLRLIPHAAGRPSRAAAPEGEAAAPELGEDWAARFRLDPPEGWELEAGAGPLSRARMRGEGGAWVEVSVRPGADEWALDPVRGRMDREVTEAIRDEHKVRYARVSGGRYGVVNFQGAPVVRVERFTLGEHGADRGQVSLATEVRFRRFGLEYAVTYVADKEAWPQDEAVIDAALGAFSFLPPLEVTAGGYSDLERGFAFALPGPEWAVAARPFDEAEPVTASTRDGRAEVIVRLVAGDDARAAVDAAFEARRKRSRYFAKERAREAEQGGRSAVEFKFEDFSPDGSKQLRFHGLAARCARGIVLVTGSSPQTDEDAKKLEREVDGILRSVRLRDPAALAETISGELEALRHLAAGAEAVRQKKGDEAVRALDRAIAAAPGYALAYALRAEAKKLAGDFDGSREDLARAAELDPHGGYVAEAAETLADEAAALQKQKRWREATEVWIRVYRSSQDEKDLKKLLSCASSLFKEQRRDAGDPNAASEMLADLLEPVETVPEVAEDLAKMHGQAAADLAGAGEFSKAKRVLKRMRKLARANRSDELEELHDKAKERLKKAEDAARGR